jgi:putative addiction module killer protein
VEPRPRTVEHYKTVTGRDLFGEWITALKDTKGQFAILRRIERLENGNFGDHEYVGGGVSELRIAVGPGYRVYYGEESSVIILLLCGGDKSTQNKDISLAKHIWASYRRSQ